MIRFYYHPTPNPLKISLFLEETGLPYEVVAVDTSKGEQHSPEFRKINPNSKVPAIVDTDGPGGKEARVFDSSAILLYLADKIGKFGGSPEDRPELVSWLFFIASGLGPFSGQAVHFQLFAPASSDYAVNRYRREAERHYQVVEDHLADRNFVVGHNYTIADMSLWGWIDRAARVHHVALATADARKSMASLRQAGAPTLPIPRNYYDDVATRLSLDPSVVEGLEPLGLLYDEDSQGQFRHAYTQPFHDRFFFEVVERAGGYAGFGAPNAAVRMAAQARLHSAHN